MPPDGIHRRAAVKNGLAAIESHFPHAYARLHHKLRQCRLRQFLTSRGVHIRHPQLGADGLPDHDEHHRELVRDSSGRRPRRRLFAPPHPSDLRGRVGGELGGSLVDRGQRRLHRVAVGRVGADRRIRRFRRVRGRRRLDSRHRGHGRLGAGGAGPASPRLSGDDPGAGHGRRPARGAHHGALHRRRSGGMRLHPPARPAVARPPDGPPRTRARERPEFRLRRDSRDMPGSSAPRLCGHHAVRRLGPGLPPGGRGLLHGA